MLTDNDLVIEIDFNFLIQSLCSDRFLSFKLVLFLCRDRQRLKTVVFAFSTRVRFLSISNENLTEIYFLRFYTKKLLKICSHKKVTILLLAVCLFVYASEPVYIKISKANLYSQKEFLYSLKILR